MEIVKATTLVSDTFYSSGMLVARFNNKSQPEIIGQVTELRPGLPSTKRNGDDRFVYLDIPGQGEQGFPISTILPIYRLSLTQPLKLPDSLQPYWQVWRGGYLIFTLGQEVALNPERLRVLTGPHDRPTAGGFIAQIHPSTGEIDVATGVWQGNHTPYLVRVPIDYDQIQPTAHASWIWPTFTS